MTLQREPKSPTLMKTTWLLNAVLAITFFLGTETQAALIVPSFVAIDNGTSSNRWYIDGLDVDLGVLNEDGGH